MDEYARDALVIATLGLRGNQYLRSRMRDFNQIAAHTGPVLVLADLDRPDDCPVELVAEWTGDMSPDPNLLLRVAAMEIEAWIMADRQTFAEWLGVGVNRIPSRPEEVHDPKRAIIELSRRSRNRSLRDRLIISRPDGLYQRGQDYNVALSNFVQSRWRPEYARRTAPSLDRAISRISNVASAH